MKSKAEGNVSRKEVYVKRLPWTQIKIFDLLKCEYLNFFCISGIEGRSNKSFLVVPALL